MSSAIVPTDVPVRAARRGHLLRADLGIFPLLLACPFMYFPKLLEGDTQPWIALGALIAVLTYRTHRFLQRGDLPLLLLALLCLPVYAVRAGFGPDLLRATYSQGVFVVLWIVARRDQGDYLAKAVRLTIVLWLAVGLYQYLIIALGLPIEISGRYIEGRSGVPSLASEPSVYGSLSMLHMMYLLSEHNPKNRPYIAAAVVSVVLSGSVLAFLLLVFPLMKLKLRWRIGALLAIPILAFVDYLMTSAGVTTRILNFATSAEGIAEAVQDPSVNLRLGHIVFTLLQNFWASLTWASPVDFMAQYNAFADTSRIFIETGSNFILTAAGDLIYSYGWMGALLMLMFIRKAQRDSPTWGRKLEKFAFIAACLLNPIYLSNVFLVMYAQRRN